MSDEQLSMVEVMSKQSSTAKLMHAADPSVSARQKGGHKDIGTHEAIQVMFLMFIVCVGSIMNLHSDSEDSSHSNLSQNSLQRAHKSIVKMGDLLQVEVTEEGILITNRELCCN